MTEPVFLDTVGILAALNTADNWHNLARPAYESLRQQDARPIVTSFVLAECANAAARTNIRYTVCLLRDQLEAAGRVVMPTEIDWIDAWGSYSRGEAGSAGLVDHLSFTVMRRMGIMRAFTNDRHFRAAGFQTMF